MPSQIEHDYGVPLPLDILWRELETRYGPDALAELQAVHRAATQRYGRAGRLNQLRRLVSFWERRGGHEQLAAWKAALADPQAYIDRDA